MTIELTAEEARMLLRHLDYYLTLTYYEWQDDPMPESEKQFIEAFQRTLLSSLGGNSVRENIPPSQPRKGRPQKSSR